jgi:hypothetical protein
MLRVLTAECVGKGAGSRSFAWAAVCNASEEDIIDVNELDFGFLLKYLGKVVDLECG